MFIVVTGTKVKGFADLTEALGEVAVMQVFSRVLPMPQLWAVDEGQAELVQFDDRQVDVLIRWVRGKV